MPTFLFTGLNLMYFQDVSQMRLLLRIKCLMIQVTCVHDIHLSIITGYQLCIPEGCNSIWMTPCKENLDNISLQQA
jgi:hypothetical protein